MTDATRLAVGRSWPIAGRSEPRLPVAGAVPPLVEKDPNTVVTMTRRFRRGSRRRRRPGCRRHGGAVPGGCQTFSPIRSATSWASTSLERPCTAGRCYAMCCGLSVVARD